MAPSFSGILYDRTFFDMIESLKDNANILVQKQGLPFMFNHFFFLKIFFVKVPYVQQRSFYRELQLFSPSNLSFNRISCQSNLSSNRISYGLWKLTPTASLINYLALHYTNCFGINVKEL